MNLLRSWGANINAADAAGIADLYEPEAVMAYPPGSVIVLPGETWHFHWAKSGEYVTQVSAIGPLGLEYHDEEDDPRAQPAQARRL